ncbi:cysteine synthase B [Candidatus Roizmanbacteria bacterium CG_4_10_14_0_8_um_filter_39_9]|uniref:Cysteine synthase B n=1 Tax=Candidatus Roizmanbacteria bacterium CG_4_10_14_0_8_um_filter_39_9 TaxID=1974829 RepID=A0A2M7QDZ7_9BACT|nr:MAG: cysteine synthase B [Candidatus Roizmanbacteria bacterium CG_4_10_14_0_8_um_filter_39_9]
MKYNTILDTIGNTPLIEITGYSYKPEVKIFAKLEGTNPGGSVKDRIALSMIRKAIINKKLMNDKTLIEATSGNTGIGIAMITTSMHIPFLAVMPESVSIERRKLLSAFGAQILLTDGSKGTNYAIEVARNMITESHKKYYSLDQFSNEENVFAHYKTTGNEIVKDIPEVTHFVAGMGTGGTLMGAGKKLKEVRSTIQIVGIEPIAGSKIQGLRNMNAYTPAIYSESKLDRKLLIPEDGLAFEYARDITKRKGISVGISSGAALWGAIETSKNITKGIIVTVFPDRGDRYISTKLFS